VSCAVIDQGDTGLMQPSRRRLGAWGLTATGAALLLLGIHLLHPPTRPQDFGAAPAPAPATALPSSGAPTHPPEPVAPTAHSSLAPIPSPRVVAAAPRPSGGPKAQPTRSARVAHPSLAAPPTRMPAPVHPAAPTDLQIPGLGLTATIRPVSSVAGTLQVPPNPRDVGWWTGSVLAGSPAGTTVIDGHVDSAALGLGIFYHLQDLQPGDPVVLTLTTGKHVTYRVQARRTYPKTTGLPAELFTPSGPARLALITCGGTFDSTAKSYNDNIVVLATPTQPAV